MAKRLSSYLPRHLPIRLRMIISRSLATGLSGCNFLSRSISWCAKALSFRAETNCPTVTMTTPIRVATLVIQCRTTKSRPKGRQADRTHDHATSTQILHVRNTFS